MMAVSPLRTFRLRKLRILCLVPCFALFTAVLALLQMNSAAKSTEDGYVYRRSRNLLFDNSSKPLCIPSGISSFPKDFFTQEERLNGGVVIHFILVLYLCATIAVVCDDYFLPSLEIISDKLTLPSDVAGATFMAIGTSAPELFSSITGSFITEGDIGVGTVIGSAVFNILAVTGLVGIVLWDQELDVDWYPITRDCAFYGVTVGLLIWIISDNLVTWWESLVLLIAFAAYVLIMYMNRTIEKSVKQMVNQWECSLCCSADYRAGERASLVGNKIYPSEIKEYRSFVQERDSFSVEFTASKVKDVLQNGEITVNIDDIVLGDECSSDGTLCTLPEGGPCSYVWWILMWPASFIFFITIPNCNSQRFQKFFALTFLMSIAWIGVLSYLAVWMVTIIGFTFSIPDSVSGLTLLAAGTSVPEIMSSIIVARGGLGNMAISNLVGSNTFDITFCLGAPWLIKSLLSDKGHLPIYSSALTYTSATLLLTLIGFYIILYAAGWKLNTTVGVACFMLYLVFLVLACMYELNVFGDINIPTCHVR